MTVAKIETEQVRVCALVKLSAVAARATRSIFVSVENAAASAATSPVPYGGY